jgi:hypothetical protein
VSWEKINKHKGHPIEFNVYAGGESYVIECCECGEILVDFEDESVDLDIETKLAGTEVPEDYFDDLVIDHCTADASAINNCGFVDQLEFLHGRGEDIDKLIKEAKGERLRQPDPA